MRKITAPYATHRHGSLPFITEQQQTQSAVKRKETLGVIAYNNSRESIHDTTTLHFNDLGDEGTK